MVFPLVAGGKVTQYEATPEYQGARFVPRALKLVVSNPGKFTTRIKIWGEASRDESAAPGPRENEP